MRPALLILALLAFDVYGEKKAPPALSCASGGDTRVIRNQIADDKSCEVLYEKNGKLQSVASAKQDADYCQSTVSKMRATLESAGFKCK
jgi:hypothetical protein